MLLVNENMEIDVQQYDCRGKPQSLWMASCMWLLFTSVLKWIPAIHTFEKF